MATHGAIVVSSPESPAITHRHQRTLSGKYRHNPYDFHNVSIDSTCVGSVDENLDETGLLYEVVSVALRQGTSTERRFSYMWEEADRPEVGQHVIVDTELGFDIGVVHAVGFLPKPAMCVKRVATRAEVAQYEQLQRWEVEAKKTVQGILSDLGVPVNVAHVEMQFDRRKLHVFYTTSLWQLDTTKLIPHVYMRFRTRVIFTRLYDTPSTPVQPELLDTA